MTFEQYQQEAVKFRTESANNEEYLTLGLIEEVGEAAGKLAKRRRDGVFDEKAFIKELGDILWFVANLADYYDRWSATNLSAELKDCFVGEVDDDRFDDSIMSLLVYWTGFFSDEGSHLSDIVFEVGGFAKKYGYTLEQVAEINLAKLRDRLSRGVICGNGDNR